MQSPSSNYRKTLFLARFALLLAIEAIFCFTPLGSITIYPLVATLSMVPVVVTAILLGPGAGTAMGFFFGLFSFLVWSFMPPNPVVAFVFTPLYNGGNFWSLVICFVPRILAGTVAGLLFRALSKPLGTRNAVPYAVGGVVGSLINTFGVLGGIFFFFGGSYAHALGKTFEVLITLIGATILTNGIPEAVVCGLAAFGVCRPLIRYFKQ